MHSSSATAAPKPIKILECALESPPLPTARGAIRKASEADEDDEAAEMGLKPYIERALKGNVRSTLRVWDPALDKKVMWAEVRENEHNDHLQIVKNSRQLFGQVT